MKRALSFAPVLLSLLLSGCAREQAAPAQPPVAQAQLVRSTAAQTPQTMETTGTLRARETAAISAQIPSHIRQVLVVAGDHVRAGQLLVLLDDEALQSALQQATAGASAAEQQQAAAAAQALLAAQTLQRYQMLQAQKSVSPQEFDEVEKRSEAAQLQVAACAAQSRQAKAAAAGARTQLGYAALHAPFAGIVTARLADPGTLAAPGGPLLEVDRDGPLQVYTAVDESIIGSVHTGMKVPVKVDGMGSPGLSGTVAQIVPAADPASRAILVKLDLPPVSGLRAGLYATADFPGAAREAILAPQSAVAMRGALACVYALDASGVAQLRYVTLGQRYGDQVEILSGVAAGETLVNDPGDRDLSGSRIASASASAGEAQR